MNPVHREAEAYVLCTLFLVCLLPLMHDILRVSDTQVPGLVNHAFTWVDTPDDGVEPTPELFPEFYLLSLDAFMTSSPRMTKADFAAVALWLSSHT